MSSDDDKITDHHIIKAFSALGDVSEDRLVETIKRTLNEQDSMLLASQLSSLASKLTCWDYQKGVIISKPDV